jgi:hypothetical protein
MKTYWGVEVQLHSVLTSELDFSEWSASCPGRFIRRDKSPRHLLDRELNGPQNRSECGGEER